MVRLSEPTMPDRNVSVYRVNSYIANNKDFNRQFNGDLMISEFITSIQHWWGRGFLLRDLLFVDGPDRLLKPMNLMDRRIRFFRIRVLPVGPTERTGSAQFSDANI